MLIFDLTEFSTDWLTAYLPACLPAYLMPSDRHNLIIAKATGLIFSLFNIASAREAPFGILQYVQCILQGITSVLLCVSFIFADSEKR